MQHRVLAYKQGMVDKGDAPDGVIVCSIELTNKSFTQDSTYSFQKEFQLLSIAAGQEHAGIPLARMYVGATACVTNQLDASARPLPHTAPLMCLASSITAPDTVRFHLYS
jgi:hypothetical protein